MQACADSIVDLRRHRIPSDHPAICNCSSQFLGSHLPALVVSHETRMPHEWVVANLQRAGAIMRNFRIDRLQIDQQDFFLLTQSGRE